MLIRIACVTLLAAGAFTIQPAQAFSLNILGQGRYASIIEEKQESDATDPKAATGIAAGLNVQFNLVDLKAIVIFAGVGFDYWGLAESTSKMKFTRTSLPLEIGVGLNALPMLTFQLSGLVDCGLSGKFTIENELGTATLNTKNDMAYGANVRGLLTVAPAVRAGLVAQYLAGSYKIKDANFAASIALPDGVDTTLTVSSEAIKYSGYTIGAVVGVSF